MKQQELHAIKYMIRNGHLVTIQCYLKDRTINLSEFIVISEYAVEYEQTEIKLWLDQFIQPLLNFSNRPKKGKTPWA